jgi:hypothetical protein
VSRLSRMLNDESGLIFVPIVIGLLIGGAVSTGVSVTGAGLNANEMDKAAKFTAETQNIVAAKATELADTDPDAAKQVGDIATRLGEVKDLSRSESKTYAIEGAKELATEVVLSAIPGGKIGGKLVGALAKRAPTVVKVMKTTVKNAGSLSAAKKEAKALYEFTGSMVLKGSGGEDAAKTEFRKSYLDPVETLLRGEKKVPERAGVALESAILAAKLQAGQGLVGQIGPNTADAAGIAALAAQIAVDTERDKLRIKASDDPAAPGAAGANALAKLAGRSGSIAGNPFLQRLAEALSKIAPAKAPTAEGKVEARAGDLDAVRSGDAGSALGVVMVGGQMKPAFVRKGATGLEVVLPLEPGSPVRPLKDDLTMKQPDFSGTWVGTFGLKVSVPGYGTAVTELPITFTVAPDGAVTSEVSYNGPVKAPGMPGGAKLTYKLAGSLTGKVAGAELAVGGPYTGTASISVMGRSASASGGGMLSVSGTFAGTTFSGTTADGQKVSASKQ